MMLHSFPAAVRSPDVSPDTPPDVSSAALMARVVTGDAAAFTLLARRLQGPALRLAQRTLQDRAAAEDVVQTALTRLWTDAARFDPARGALEAWVRRIVINLCLDRRRALRPVQPIEDAYHLASPAPDPLAASIDNDQRSRLDAAMARLNARQRAALVLFHGEGLTMAEIAAEMDTTPKAVEGLLGRARMELKMMLTESPAL